MFHVGYCELVTEAVTSLERWCNPQPNAGPYLAAHRAQLLTPHCITILAVSAQCNHISRILVITIFFSVINFTSNVHFSDSMDFYHYLAAVWSAAATLLSLKRHKHAPAKAICKKKSTLLKYYSLAYTFTTLYKDGEFIVIYQKLFLLKERCRIQS